MGFGGRGASTRSRRQANDGGNRVRSSCSDERLVVANVIEED